MSRATQDSRTQPAGTESANHYPDPLKTLIWNAVLEQATDVHLHCITEGLRVLHRVDGIIHPKLLLSAAEGRRLLNQLKSAAGLTIVRSFSPLEGQIVWPDENLHWEIRVTFTPVGNRESAHLRFLSVPRDQWDMSRLGFAPADQEKISTTIHSPNGLVLITGATGSGKTTSMYCLASLLDLRTTTTYSIEDPVEFKIPYIQQIEVDEYHGLTMHEGLRTILRMDPDLILVGEIRDGDSALVAARAALSGRLVLATIHAQDAAGAIDSLHYLGVPYHIIGSSLRLVIAQNLVRRLCRDCNQPRDMADAEREVFTQFGVEPPEHLWDRGAHLADWGLERTIDTNTPAEPVELQPIGCPECHSYGYKGRTGIFEVATIEGPMTSLIRSGADHQQLWNCLRQQGTRSMMQDGLEKVVAGVTSLEELTRVCGCARRAESPRPAADPVMQIMTN
ncbi:MAG: Flp pilus assembly complex ATPase component TadA [Planctomycetes bacterium]|jgi:general secretion pathway protein E|nr:Flp pilus assembly complex ATPase component TadA [Planctomycetota bacterium]